MELNFILVIFLASNVFAMYNAELLTIPPLKPRHAWPANYTVPPTVQMEKQPQDQYFVIAFSSALGFVVILLLASWIYLCVLKKKFAAKEENVEEVYGNQSNEIGLPIPSIQQNDDGIYENPIRFYEEVM